MGNLKLICGLCRREWSYSGSDPQGSIDEHHAAYHATPVAEEAGDE